MDEAHISFAEEIADKAPSKPYLASGLSPPTRTWNELKVLSGDQTFVTLFGR